jgi:hypothetical protein
MRTILLILTAIGLHDKGAKIISELVLTMTTFGQNFRIFG